MGISRGSMDTSLGCSRQLQEKAKYLPPTMKLASLTGKVFIEEPKEKRIVSGRFSDAAPQMSHSLNSWYPPS